MKSNKKICVVGAGVIGLAVANKLSEYFNNIIVFERNDSFGEETSSRNSEVIHSGIYYPSNSLKSELCATGNKLLYDYCGANNICINKCGKIIVASNKAQKNELKRLELLARKKSIKYRWLSKAEIEVIEPNVFAEYGLHIYDSGVVDSHGLMSSLYQDLLKNDVDIVFRTEVCDISKIQNGYEIQFINPDTSKDKIHSDIIINCAGLYSNQISMMAGIIDKNYELHFWRGDYFWLKKKKDFIKSLIYPIPEKNLSGLGIHTTVDISGRIKIGPDSEYIGQHSKFDFNVNMEKKKHFFDVVKEYIKNVSISDLEPDYVGVRPKLQSKSMGFKDFIILEEHKRGYPGFFNLIGIESPGLTSCLSIADYVKNLVVPI